MDFRCVITIGTPIIGAPFVRAYVDHFGYVEFQIKLLPQYVELQEYKQKT